MESRIPQNLLEALTKGPAVLYLGQEVLRFATGFDPLLQALGAELGLPSTPKNYLDLVAGPVNPASPNFQRLGVACAAVGTPEWLARIADFPWRVVYSSAIDNCWPQAFRKPWRALQPYFRPPAGQILGSRQRLACNYLFGGIAAPDAAGKPPLNRLDFKTAKQQAAAVVNALDEIITPIGCLIIEAYDPEQDWLELDVLLGLINRLSTNQVFIFSATPSLAENPDVKHLVTGGQLHVSSEPLLQILAGLEERGAVLRGPPAGDVGGGRSLRIKNRQVNLATEKWINISRVGRPLDLSIFQEPKPASPEKRYQEFREFLMNSSAVPIWSAYENGFAFRRDSFAAEDYDASLKSTLWSVVKSSLTRRYSTGKSVVLHGAAGSGKTVMLGLLAHGIAKQGEFPVLFIPQHIRIVDREPIEQFCKWAEDNQAAATLVVWDGMREPSEYQNLVSYLEGTRGRRVVLVGSAYHKQREQLRGTIAVEVEPQLTEPERKRFPKFLSRIKPGAAIPHVLENIIERDGGYFFLALYRLLPETASNLTLAVEQEARYWEGIESAFSRRLATTSSSVAINTLELAFDYALRNRHVIAPSPATNVPSAHPELSSDLIRLVMVPSQYRLFVPIELVARILGRESWQGIRETSAYSDLIEIIDDSEEDSLLLRARNPEEARIYCKSTIRSTEEEVAIIKRLITKAKLGSEMFGQPELDFVTQLLSVVHDDSNRRRFSPFFIEIADALKAVRERGKISARLILQEATFRRKSLATTPLRPEPERLALLREATATLTESLGQREVQQNLGLQSQILSELASCYGFCIKPLIVMHKKAEAKEAFTSAHTFAKQARRDDPANVHAVDIIAWTCLDAARSNVFSQSEAVEAIADAIASITAARPANTEAETQLLSRLMELARQIGDSHLTSKAFHALEQKGSAAGYYVTVVQQLPEQLLKQVIVGTEEPLTEGDKDLCRRQCDYLREYEKIVLKDFRAAYLMLRLWWMAKTGRALLKHEHLRVAFTPDDWRLLLAWSTAISRSDDGVIITPARFIEAVAHFHLRHAPESEDAFNSIRNTSDPGRIRRRLIASNQNGSPLVVSDGIVSRASSQSASNLVRGDKSLVRFSIAETEFEVPFRPQDFYRSDIHEGDALDPFVIAFNFIGPFAYPQDYRTEI